MAVDIFGASTVSAARESHLSAFENGQMSVKMSGPVCAEKCSKLMRYTHFYRMQSIVFGSCLSQ